MKSSTIVVTCHKFQNNVAISSAPKTSKFSNKNKKNYNLRFKTEFFHTDNFAETVK